MNTSLQALAVALSISAVPAFAAPSAPVADQRIVISAPAPATTSLTGAALMQSLAGSSQFAMSDGQRMELSARGSHLRMRYAGRAAVTLRPNGAGAYTSGDGRFELVASRDAFGDPQVRLTRPYHLD